MNHKMILAIFFCMALLLGCNGGSSENFQGLGGGGGIELHLINNCKNLPLNVLVNTTGVWKSGGLTKCAGGDTCTLSSGYYTLDLKSSGLDFFVGPSPDNATKAEVTYLDVLTYDISTISTSDCPETCTSPSCCKNGFNQSVKITTTPSCRCVSCDSETCPDAYHWPHDDTKQIRCDPTGGISQLTIEFCPTTPACSNPAGISNCSTDQLSICSNSADQPCTGSKDICCPQSSYGASHACYCESAEAYCNTAPDAGSGCGSDLSNYCYIQFQE